MKRGILYIYLLAILLPAGFSCSPQDSCVGEHVALFYREELKFQRLVEALRSDQAGQRRQGHLLFWKSFSNHTKKKLQELGITHVHLHPGGRHVDLKTNWGAARPVYLCYRAAGGPSSRHESFTILHQLNASWALCAKTSSGLGRLPALRGPGAKLVNK